MKPTDRTDTIYFTVKGQVVIPRWLRKEFEIEAGTRAIVYQDGDHIALQPVTPKYIHRLRGSLRGTKAMEVFLAERQRERDV